MNYLDKNTKFNFEKNINGCINYFNKNMVIIFINKNMVIFMKFSKKSKCSFEKVDKKTEIFF